MKILLPILILAIAGVTVFVFTTPMLEAIDGLKLERERLTIADDNAAQLEERQAQLIDTYNKIDSEQRDRLEQFLPNNIDNVRLIIDINDIADHYGLSIKNPNIVTAEDGTGKQAANSTPESTLIAFSITSSYELFKDFLKDLARSLRLVDVESVVFTATDNNLYNYQVSLRTYWLK